MENKLYRIDYNEALVNDIWFTPDSDYIWCADDETAIKEGKKLAEKGIDFPDFGHCNLTLIQIVEVDDDSECFNDKRVVWY
jgi:hypothetical protein